MPETRRPLRYIHVGTGGWGGMWVSQFLPRLTELGKAEAVAAVDIDPRHLEAAETFLKVPAERCYTNIERAFAAHRDEADFAIVVVPPAHHEAVIDVALTNNLHV